MFEHAFDTEKQTLTLKLGGAILSTNEGAIHRKIISILESVDFKNFPLKTLILDLTQVVMMDSIGIGMLVSIIQRIKESGGTVVAKVLDGLVGRSLHFARLNEQIEITLVK